MNGWLEPFRPGRYLGASRLTLVAAGAVPALFFAFNMVGIVGESIRTLPLGVVAVLASVTAILMIIAFLLATISFARDLIVGVVGRARDVSRRRRRDAETEAELRGQGASIGGDLQAIYDRHHLTLVEEARAVLEPDRYGRRDSEAAAREFSYFQDRVAKPELERMGYPGALIDEMFARMREALLAPILKDIG